MFGSNEDLSPSGRVEFALPRAPLDAVAEESLVLAVVPPFSLVLPRQVGTSTRVVPPAAEGSVQLCFQFGHNPQATTTGWATENYPSLLARISCVCLPIWLLFSAIIVLGPT